VSILFAVAVGGGVTTMGVAVPLNTPCQILLFDSWPATVNKYTPLCTQSSISISPSTSPGCSAFAWK